MRENPKYLEKIIGYKFKDLGLLVQAITHRSYNNKNNERFEFLGDALLDLIIGEELFKKFNKATEGQLTRLRSNLVKKEALIELAKRFEITKYILLGEGELKSGGLQRESILADSIEAIIAAVYLDSDFKTCKELVLHWYESKIKEINLESFSTKDSKTILQEWLQARQYDLPEYIVVGESGSPHDKEFKVKCKIDKLNVTAEGIGKSIRKAEQQAAKIAMQKILKK